MQVAITYLSLIFYDVNKTWYESKGQQVIINMANCGAITVSFWVSSHYKWSAHYAMLNFNIQVCYYENNICYGLLRL